VTLRLSWGGSDVTIAAPDPDAAAFLARYLACPVAKSPRVTRPDIVIERGATTDRVVYPDGALMVRSEAASRLALLEAVAYVLTTRHGGTILHAGGILGPHGVLGLLGAPRAGKSYLAHAAWRSGRLVLGDDRIAWSGASARALPKCLKIRLGRADRLATVAAGIPRAQRFAASLAGDRRLVLARSLTGFAPVEADYPIRGLVVVEQGSDASSRLASIKATEALERLAAVAGAGVASPIALLRVLKARAEEGKMPLLTVGAGDADRALSLLDRL
jgi:hypothetical protein